jgi:CRP-like cAMP-binding protein
MPTVEIIPFSPGRRPTDEARHAGMGSSDAVAFLTGECFLLLAVDGGDGCAIDATLIGPHGPLPGWDRRPIEPTVFEAGASGEPVLRPRALGADRPYVLALEPEHDLPGDYSFATLFSQPLDVHVRLTRDGSAVAEAATRLEVYDVAQFGSLYERIVERLVKPDTERQSPGLSHAYHPWFPVLLIGAHKAELYTRALIGDIVGKRRNLADPGWLVRVGLYLEFLTALGVIEAVKDEAGDLLTPEEREAYEHGEAFAEIRRRVNITGWRGVWALRHIALRGQPRTGPVSALNLLNKRRATLEFLHVHHEDLQHAIELAGANEHNAQETWHRVFRDAERAVLRQTPDAFPELGFLPPEVRKLVLWHRQGHLGLRRVLRVPGPLPRLLGDQDGLFASACNQYRASMNHVADWAQQRGLMDHTGEESVPRQVSLLEAHMNQPSRVALLQRRDGYDSDHLEVGAELPVGYEPPLKQLAELLTGTTLFSLLNADEIATLTRTARPLTFGPMERVIVQGQEGDSLFVIVEGKVEVLLRRSDGSEVSLGTRPNGTVIGEISVLTGEPRSATVRAIDGAVVYEVGRRQYAPILAGRPELVDALTRAMVSRLQAQDEKLGRYDAEHRRLEITRRLRRLVS